MNMNVKIEEQVASRDASELAKVVNHHLKNESGSVEMLRKVVSKLGGNFMTLDDWGKIQSRVVGLPMGARDETALASYLVNGGEPPKTEREKMQSMPGKKKKMPGGVKTQNATKPSPERSTTGATDGTPFHQRVKSVVYDNEFSRVPKHAIFAMDEITLNHYEKRFNEQPEEETKKARVYTEKWIHQQRTRLAKGHAPKKYTSPFPDENN